MTADLAADVAVSNASLRRYLHGLPGVDQVGAEGRAAMLSTRSIKAASKERAIDLAISMVDLTTLEGMDTPGKVTPAATLPVTLILLEAVRDWYRQTGQRIGVKPAGGIRTSKDAIRYLVMINEVCGEAWLTPDLFRFGASALLNDLLQQRQRMRTGHYSGPDYVTID